MRQPEQSLPVRHPSLSSAACTESLQNGAIILIEQLLPVRENLNLEKAIMRLLKKLKISLLLQLRVRLLLKIPTPTSAQIVVFCTPAPWSPLMRSDCSSEA